MCSSLVKTTKTLPRSKGNGRETGGGTRGVCFPGRFLHVRGIDGYQTDRNPRVIGGLVEGRGVKQEETGMTPTE